MRELCSLGIANPVSLNANILKGSFLVRGWPAVFIAVVCFIRETNESLLEQLGLWMTFCGRAPCLIHLLTCCTLKEHSDAVFVHPSGLALINC